MEATTLKQAVRLVNEQSVSPEEAAADLGVATTTVHSMLHRNQIQGIRIGRAVRISRVDLEKALAARQMTSGKDRRSRTRSLA